MCALLEIILKRRRASFFFSFFSVVFSVNPESLLTASEGERKTKKRGGTGTNDAANKAEKREGRIPRSNAAKGTNVQTNQVETKKTRI